MSWRSIPSAFIAFLAAITLASPLAAAQDELFVAGLVIAILAIPIGIRVALGWWIYVDARRRGKKAALWILAVVLHPLLGGILWYMERDKPAVVYSDYYYPPPAYYYGAPPAYGPGEPQPTTPGGFRPSVSCRYCGVQMPLGSMRCPTCGARQR